MRAVLFKSFSHDIESIRQPVDRLSESRRRSGCTKPLGTLRRTICCRSRSTSFMVERKGLPTRTISLRACLPACVRGAVAGRFSDINNRDDLWWMLLAITQQKAVDLVRHEVAQKRGGGRVLSEAASASSRNRGPRDFARRFDWQRAHARVFRDPGRANPAIDRMPRRRSAAKCGQLAGSKDTLSRKSPPS